MDRKTIPQATETAVLRKCLRRCAICFGLNLDLSDKLGQIAHLDQDRSNAAEDNLAFLCMDHHSLYDSTTSQHKNFTLHEVKAMRAELQKAIERREHAISSPIEATPKADPDAARFWAQRKLLPNDTPAIRRVWAGPHWQISIRPTRFLEAQFQTLADCENFVRRRRVERTGENGYPNMITSQTNFFRDTDISGVRGETNVPEMDNELCECWAMFRSGQFVHNRAVPDHKETPGIHYLEILRVTSQLYEFARRMVEEDVLSPVALVEVSLINVAGLNLYVPDRFPSTHNKSQRVDLKNQFALEEIRGISRELALDAAVQFYSSFQWNDPDPAKLRREQRRYV